MTDKKEIAYFNYSTGDVVEGYDVMFHALSEPATNMDKTGAVKMVDNFNGRRREVSVNIKGRTALDQQRRGGEALWQRIYTVKDLEAKLEKQGMTVSLEEKKPKVKN